MLKYYDDIMHQTLQLSVSYLHRVLFNQNYDLSVELFFLGILHNYTNTFFTE